MVKGNETIGNKIIRYRWPVGIVIWGLLTLLQIHGSSIGIYAYLLGEPQLDTAIIGLNRVVQIDEWGVFTPFIFSQYYDGGTGAFSAISQIIRATPTDVRLVYALPCWDFSTLFRPFLLGFLFFPKENGLAFFWMGRLIFLFLASYECGLLLTDKNKGLAFGYACLIAFSQMVQVWFAENGFVEMLIAGQLVLVLLSAYMKRHSYWLRMLYALGIAYCMVVYFMSFYPAWQISFGYVFLILVGWILYKNKTELKLTNPNNIMFLSVLVFFVLVITSTCIQSWSTIQYFIHSEYPGHRQISGGMLSWPHLLEEGLVYLTPLKTFTLWSPLDEVVFLSFAPLGMVLFMWRYIKTKSWDGLCLSLIIFIMVVGSFVCISWPTFLNELTLLFVVPEKRLLQASSFAQVVLLIRMLSLEKERYNKRVSIGIVLISLGIEALCAVPLLTTFQAMDGLAIVLCMFLLGALFICRFKCMLPVFFFIISLLTGMLMNPLSQGTNSIYATDLGQKMQRIPVTNNDKWIVDSDNDKNLAIHAFNNYPLFFGHPTINSSNMYVDWQRWNTFNLSERQRKILNRSCYMNMHITKESTEFYCPNEDLMVANVVNIRMNVDDLSKLGVTHIMTHRDFSDMSTEHVDFTLIEQANNCNIYAVSYQ